VSTFILQLYAEPNADWFLFYHRNPADIYIFPGICYAIQKKEGEFVTEHKRLVENIQAKMAFYVSNLRISNDRDYFDENKEAEYFFANL